MGSPDRSALAASSTPASSTCSGCGDAGTGAGPCASPHWQSDGTIIVAPSPVRAALIAAAVSAASSCADRVPRTHPETGAAREAMSLVSGASKARW